MDELAQRLGLLQQTLEKTLEAFEARNRDAAAREADLRAQLKAIDTLLRGNGVPGIVSRLSVLEGRDETREQELARLESAQGRLLWAIIWALAGVAGSLGLTILGLVTNRGPGP